MAETPNGSQSGTAAIPQHAETPVIASQEPQSSNTVQTQRDSDFPDEQSGGEQGMTGQNAGAASQISREERQSEQEGSRSDIQAENENAESPTSVDPQPAIEPKNANKKRTCVYEDVYLRSQLQKVQDMLEASISERTAGKAEKPLIEILTECIPEDSPLAFALNFGRMTTGVNLTVDNDRDLKTFYTLDDAWNQIEMSNTSENRVLVLNNINSEWCEAICTRFPDSIDRTSILEHILRLDFSLFDHDLSTFSYPRIPGLMHSFNRLRKLLWSRQMGSAKCFHASYWWQYENKRNASQTTEFSIRDLERFEEGWSKPNAFISCYRLRENLHLVLTSWVSPWSKKKRHERLSTSDPMICLASNPVIGTMLRLPFQRLLVNMFFIGVEDMLQRNQTIFSWNRAAECKADGWQATFTDGMVFTSQIAATLSRLEVEGLETLLRDLVYSANIESDAERFAELINFRRHIGRLYLALAESRSSFHTITKEYLPPRGIPSHSGAASVKSLKPSLPSDFRESYLDTLKGLEKRLDAIKENLNEEIQVAIGAVQVQDAQIMKEQTMVTVRQTNVTVVLAVLAAVYLPMTLVTGIFGMNITEISSESTAPSAWWVVVVWLATLVLTAGGISIYLVVRRLKAKEKKKKACEADTEEGLLSSDEDDSESSHSGPRATGWKGIKIGKWRKKTKKH